jgi:hypothetical protein
MAALISAFAQRFMTGQRDQGLVLFLTLCFREGEGFTFGSAAGAFGKHPVEDLLRLGGDFSLALNVPTESILRRPSPIA